MVLAAGGFQGDAEMRTRYLGPGWELAKVRGTRFNTGDGIKMALEIGASPFGTSRTGHLGASPHDNARARPDGRARAGKGMERMRRSGAGGAPIVGSAPAEGRGSSHAVASFLFLATLWTWLQA